MYASKTPTERSNVTPQAASENCKVNNTKSPRQVINVITSPSAKQHLDIEKPDPRYSQQQLIYSAFVHQGRFTRSWTFTDIRPEGGLMEQDFLETNAGFSNLLLGCSKADCPLKKSGSWARVSASKNRTITGCCKQQFPGRAAGIARSSQSRSRFCARTSKSNSNVKMKSLGLEKKQSSETTMKSKPMHAHTRLHTCRNVACTKGKTESEVRHFERLDVMTDEEDAKMLGEYKRPLDRKDVLKQLDALIIEMNKMPTHININETRP
ncbi:unnamed protein product, partial [Mesorhabditis belari]|uniref:Uncharacterized protein n=1 Tax=Mesorhabditis belari TaxID=2138241 RepID=A0AAF3FHE8_9BILA